MGLFNIVFVDIFQFPGILFCGFSVYQDVDVVDEAYG